MDTETALFCMVIFLALCLGVSSWAYWRLYEACVKLQRRVAELKGKG